MAITSTDIQNQSFAIDRKGYMVDEVDDFLEHVADEIDGLNNLVADLREQLAEKESEDFAGFDVPAQNEPETVSYDNAALDSTLEAQKDEIASLKAQLAEAQADGNAIAQALIVAQRSADEILHNARSRADQIVADAQEEAADIINKAEAERQRVEDSIDALEDERANVRASYQDILKDFIADATQKLSALSIATYDVPSAHARVASPATARPAAQAAVREPEPYEAAFAAVAASQPVVAAATPNPLPIEKDFSGFGDTDDDFEFDDID